MENINMSKIYDILPEYEENQVQGICKMITRIVKRPIISQTLNNIQYVQQWQLYKGEWQWMLVDKVRLK